MAKGYWIARVDVHNDEGYKPYMAANPAIFQKFGGGIGLPTSVLYSRDGRKIMTTIGSLLVNQSQDKLVKAVEAQL